MKHNAGSDIGIEREPLFAGAAADHAQAVGENLVELGFMVDWLGMSPMQALVSATSTAARVMKIDGAGSLQSGKWADLVVLNANPLMDIKNTRQIDSVYIGGRKVNMAAVSGTN